MKLIIREEEKKDYSEVEELVRRAFEIEGGTLGGEDLLVRRLRRPGNLSLVALADGLILGHIMLSQQFIRGGGEDLACLALAPLAVLPTYQNKGIGSELVREAIKRAKKMDHGSIFVLGHQDYYPRFGFKKASYYGVKAPFEVEDENFMAMELKEYGLQGVRGTLIYSQEFYD